MVAMNKIEIKDIVDIIQEALDSLMYERDGIKLWIKDLDIDLWACLPEEYKGSSFDQLPEEQPEGEWVEYVNRRYKEWERHKRENDKKAEEQLERFKYKPEKQEEWRGRWWKLKDSQDSRRIALLNNCMEDKPGSLQEYMRYQGEEKAEEVDFISQLLSERIREAKAEGEHIAYDDIVETILADDDTDILKYAQEERMKLSKLNNK